MEKEKQRLIVSTRYHPSIDKWTGLKVNVGVKGTHQKYDVIYNGECHLQYFDTEQEAKNAAIEAKK
jgi:hypothetical protein